MHRRASSPAVRQGKCRGCSRAVLRQLVDGLTVNADPTGISRDEETEVRKDPNRLTWCLIDNSHGPPRLRWIHSWHPPDCPHPHVACHQCPPAEPTTLF
ncbi:hypothetical protein [Streptomyces sp. NPDC088733]|uniref:hypothetical protein n=1 Tax=Streptomyces sp. NPDC088733 TaxID=3365880 RepID=UPI0037F76592